jgi:hypothetical protein
MARPKMFEGEIARLNVLLTKDIHKKFKLVCMKNDMEMSDFVRQMIEKEIERSEK